MPTNPYGEVKIEIVSLQARITMGPSQSPYATLRGMFIFLIHLKCLENSGHVPALSSGCMLL